jgi:hypothetical protein
MYDQEASTQTKKDTDGHQRQADLVGNSDGKLHPVHLRIGYGN